ncbi:hypothetical protein PENTCL1PPCAC_19092, partial [Pristionchus entomophagus]
RFLAIFVKTRGINTASRIMYKMLMAAEVCIMLTILIFVTLVIRITWRCSLFHPNFRRLITFLLANAYLYIFSRIPLIIHQERVFRLDLRDGANALEIILISASILRLYHALTIIFLYCATVVERICATIYMHNYELKKRLHISIVLRLLVVGISLFLALELTYVSKMKTLTKKVM